MKEKVKEESRRNTYVFQGFLTQNFFVRMSRKIQDLIGGAIVALTETSAVSAKTDVLKK